VTGVVLAAGAGRRMKETRSPGGDSTLLERPKLLLPFRGRPLLAWTVALVEGLPLARRLIVLGAQAKEVEREIPFSGWEVVVNQDWPRGMGTSLRRAAECVEGGMLVFLGDMPCVPEEAARAVLARAGDRPVAPAYRGQRGFPVYLPSRLRPQLLTLSGDVGARDLIGDCELIPWDDPGVVWDVDCEEDLACARPDRLRS